MRSAALALSLCFALLGASSLLRESGTWDEYLLGIGLRRDLPDARFHPPLSSWVHSLPLRVLGVPDAIWAEPSGPRRGQQIVALRGDDWMLDSARLALLPFGVALGWIAFFWGRRLYGAAGGLLAMALVCLDPNLIAHAGLITPDVTLSASAAFALYRIARLAEAPSLRSRLLAGTAVGVMLLAKYTALLLLPIFLITDLAARTAAAGGPGRALFARAARDWLALLGLALGVLWAGYGFEVERVATSDGRSWLLPAAHYVEGALYQWRQSRLPHDFFLLGEVSQRGWWYFYLAVAALKVPLASLLLLALAGFAGRWLGVRARAAELYLWLPALLLLAYLSGWNTIQNGYRYLLPVWTPLCVLAGRLALPAARSRAFAAALCLPLAWLVASTGLAWPEYLAYVNELGGGTRQGYRYLSDSNLDWGQDLGQLARWMREHGVPRIQLAYFGTADPHHWGIDYVALPSSNSALPPTPPLAPGEPAPHVVALSAYEYQGVAFPGTNPYAPFHELEPNDVVGGSILIFDLDHPLPRGRRATRRPSSRRRMRRARSS